MSDSVNRQFSRRLFLGSGIRRSSRLRRRGCRAAEPWWQRLQPLPQSAPHP